MSTLGQSKGCSALNIGENIIYCSLKGKKNEIRAKPGEGGRRKYRDNGRNFWGGQRPIFVSKIFHFSSFSHENEDAPCPKIELHHFSRVNNPVFSGFELFSISFAWTEIDLTKIEWGR